MRYPEMIRRRRPLSFLPAASKWDRNRQIAECGSLGT
jgi:hypothetical protein